MKKSILSLAAILVLATSTTPMFAAVSGTNPRPQAVSGTNPRPQVVDDPSTDSSTADAMTMMQIFMTYLGM